MAGSVIGWDVGGAHLKAARVEDGRVVDVVQLPCPLWLRTARLACGELVYTGLTRSFLMSLCRMAPVAGAWTPLACEHFATSADVYRILGELPEDADQLPAADGRDKTIAASRARLARMVGRDAAEL